MSTSSLSSLDRFFELRARSTTVAREFRGAIATFLTMAYILFANPHILGEAGVPVQSAVACTALAAGICSILMGLVANFPLALASGMGLNAFVAYTLVLKLGLTWQQAMGLVVLDGIVTLLLVLAGLREAVMHAIPRDLRLATGAGIGLFIAFIGLVNAKFVLLGVPEAPVRPGTLRDATTWIALIGLIVTGVLLARRFTGALVIGIVITTVIAMIMQIAKPPSGFALPTFEAAFQADVRGALRWSFLPLLFSLVMVDFFDTLGTATAVAEEAKLIDERGRIPRVRRILIVDSISASIGGMLGASSVTSYIESASGIAEGARTGLHSVFVGIFFLLAIFLAPLMSFVPAAATAPALILVGFLMIAQLARIDFTNVPAAIGAFVILITIPLTYSIAHGIGYGFIAYTAISALSGRWRAVHPLMYCVSAVFAAYFVWGVS